MGARGRHRACPATNERRLWWRMQGCGGTRAQRGGRRNVGRGRGLRRLRMRSVGGINNTLYNNKSAWGREALGNAMLWVARGCVRGRRLWRCSIRDVFRAVGRRFGVSCQEFCNFSSDFLCRRVRRSVVVGFGGGEGRCARGGITRGSGFIRRFGQPLLLKGYFNHRRRSCRS